MNICLECGITFDEEETKSWMEEHGEKISGCPKCLGGYAHAERCGKCGEYFPDGSLYDGICRKCLEECIDYETGLQFMEELKYINIFMLEFVLDSEMPYRVSDKLAEVLRQQYRREMVNDKIFGTHAFLDNIRQYILDDDGDYGKEAFAKWLRRRENAKNKAGVYCENCANYEKCRKAKEILGVKTFINGKVDCDQYEERTTDANQ